MSQPSRGREKNKDGEKGTKWSDGEGEIETEIEGNGKMNCYRISRRKAKEESDENK